MKKDLAKLLNRSGAGRVSRMFLSRPHGVVLAYHKVCPAAEGQELMRDLIVGPEQFERQVRYVSEHYRLITADELLSFHDRTIKENVALITFDDAYLDNFIHAYPVLRRYNAPAVVFVPTAYIGGRRSFYWEILSFMLSGTRVERVELQISGGRFACDLRDPSRAYREICAYLKSQPMAAREQFIEQLGRELDYHSTGRETELLSWEQMREMRSGGIAFGSHGHTHEVFAGLDRTRKIEELEMSKKILDRELRQDTVHWAYPYGEESDRSAGDGELLRQCGYQTALTMTQGSIFPSGSLLDLRRIGVGGHDDGSIFQLKLSGLIPFWNRIRP